MRDGWDTSLNVIFKIYEINFYERNFYDKLKNNFINIFMWLDGWFIIRIGKLLISDELI